MYTHTNVTIHFVGSGFYTYTNKGVHTHTNANIHFVGTGFRSPQQRARRLLELLDPDLGAALGKKPFTTGEYAWNEKMMSGLLAEIETKVSIWAPTSSPYGYDSACTADLALWRVRRQSGLSWVKSAPALLYQTHAKIFKSVTVNQGRTAFAKCLEQYTVK